MGGKKKKKTAFLLVFDTDEQMQTRLFGRVVPSKRDECAVYPAESSSSTSTSSGDESSVETDVPELPAASSSASSTASDIDDYTLVGTLRMYQKNEAQ